jgi:hypothetical protein
MSGLYSEAACRRSDIVSRGAVKTQALAMIHEQQSSSLTSRAVNATLGGSDVAGTVGLLSLSRRAPPSQRSEWLLAR